MWRREVLMEGFMYGAQAEGMLSSNVRDVVQTLKSLELSLDLMIQEQLKAPETTEHQDLSCLIQL